MKTTKENISVDHRFAKHNSEQRLTINRLKKLSGQLLGVCKMIENNRNSQEIIIQLSACESAIKKTTNLFLKQHFKNCTVKKIQNGNINDAIDELSTLIDTIR